MVSLDALRVNLYRPWKKASSISLGQGPLTVPLRRLFEYTSSSDNASMADSQGSDRELCPIRTVHFPSAGNKYE